MSFRHSTVYRENDIRMCMFTEPVDCSLYGAGKDSDLPVRTNILYHLLSRRAAGYSSSIITAFTFLFIQEWNFDDK